MANVYVSYHKAPKIIGDVIQNPGEFISSDVLSTATSDSSAIPEGTVIIEVWGDAAHYSTIGATAAAGSTVRAQPANTVYFYTDGFTPGKDTIAAIDI